MPNKSDARDGLQPRVIRSVREIKDTHRKRNSIKTVSNVAYSSTGAIPAAP